MRRGPAIDRRAFLAGLGAASASGCRGAGQVADSGPTILLKSGWQTVNIGDIAHTPGMLALLEKHLPEARVVLWPIAIDDAVERMLLARFPRLAIAPKPLRTHKPLDDDAVRAMFQRADFYLHGSGPNPMAVDHLRQWIRLTGKPFGFAGITVPYLHEDLVALLSRARFVGCRETRSLEFLREKGVRGPRLSLAPDAAFACDVVDEAKAAAFMREHDLRPGRYACFVPRLRWTPFHKMDQWYRLSPEKINETERVNAATAEKDHAKLRRAIVGWVRGSGMKAVLCPEMSYAVDIIDPLVYDPLPADVKENVVRRKSFWITDEASAVYRHGRAVAGIEIHSPILAVAQGVPAIHIRQPEDTWKGQMWRDVGLAEWLFEIDETDGDDVARALLRIDGDDRGAQATIRKAREKIAALHAEMADLLRQAMRG